MADWKNAPKSDRDELWKYSHARHCFNLAKKSCEALLESSVVKGSPEHYCMLVGIHVLYGRPFKEWGEKRLSDVIVPNQHLNTHKALIEHRDKVFAHIDTGDKAAKTTCGESLTKLLLVKNSSEITLEMASIAPREAGVDMIIGLCEAMGNKCDYYLGKVLRKYSNEHLVSMPHGKFELTVSDESFASLISE